MIDNAKNLATMQRYFCGNFSLEERDIIKESEKVWHKNKNTCINDFSFEIQTEQERILNELSTNGVAISHVTKLLNFESFKYFKNIDLFFENMENDPEIQFRLKSVTNSGKTDNIDKPFEVNSIDFLGRKFLLFDNLVQCILNDEILNIVNRFYEMASKIYYFKAWIHPQMPKNRVRTSSQRWHKDPEDFNFIRVFIYCSDINEENGALEYVCGSATGGKYSHLQNYRIKNRYPPDNFIEDNVNSSDIICAEGKKGTIVFTDNNGFHRGGYVKKGQRKMCVSTFLKPLSLLTTTEVRHRHQLEQFGEEFNKLSEMSKYAVIR